MSPSRPCRGKSVKIPLSAAFCQCRLTERAFENFLPGRFVVPISLFPRFNLPISFGLMGAKQTMNGEREDEKHGGHGFCGDAGHRQFFPWCEDGSSGSIA